MTLHLPLILLRILSSAQIRIPQLEVMAWRALAAGHQEESLSLLAEAAVPEEATPKHPVTPAPTLRRGNCSVISTS